MLGLTMIQILGLVLSDPRDYFWASIFIGRCAPSQYHESGNAHIALCPTARTRSPCVASPVSPCITPRAVRVKSILLQTRTSPQIQMPRTGKFPR